MGVDIKNVPNVIGGIEFVFNGEIKVTSSEVAGKFERRHNDVMKTIKNLECSSEFSLRNYSLSDYKTLRGKTVKCYNMTEKGFMFLVMGFTGKDAAAWKEKFIHAFESMRQYIKEEEHRKIVRAKSAMNAPEMTDALKLHRKTLGKDTKPHHYSNEFDMINRIVLGVTKKKWCQMEEIDGRNFRDALTPVQIEAVENLQTANTVLIDTGLEYQDRKQKLETIYKKKFADRCLDEIVRLNA